MCGENDQIGYCGYDCSCCAARSEDPVVRQKVVDGWRKFYGHQNYTAENVKCCGCRGGEGQIADKGCEVRPCAKEKNIESCVDCEQFACDRIRKLAASKDWLLLMCYPATSTLTQEEYDLCMKQFLSMPNLIRKMIARNKLPEWLKKEYE